MTLVSNIFILVAWVGFLYQPARAVEVETLPHGVRMSEVRFGYVSGLEHAWAKDGNLYDIGEMHSVTFDAATLARVNERARVFVETLDRFGNHDLGEKIELGTLNVKTSPQIQFTAPVFAYGLNDKWTLGFGIPIIRYKNDISLSAGGSNVAFYQQQLRGFSQQLDDALKVDVVAEAQKVISEKGYRPLQNRDQSFIGDVQIVVNHRLSDLGYWRFLHQMTLCLPTGPKEDPDDLMAINVFGRTTISNMIIAAKNISRKITFLPFAGVDVPLPDRVLKRVPKNEDDNLPDQSQRQEVARWLGPSANVGGEIRWAFANRWETKTDLEATSKMQDRFNGQGRTDLLEKNTSSNVVRVKGGLGYSTVDDYRLGKSVVPTRVALEIADTVYGQNIERQLRTEVSATLFF